VLHGRPGLPFRAGATFDKKKEKQMKLRSSALALAGLLVFGVSAGPALAQRDATKPAPRLQHYDPDQPATVPAPAADNSQLKTRSNASGDFTDTCTYTFTIGSGRTYLQFCVTVNGNITEFQSPSGVEQLSPGGSSAFEGYGICDLTNSNTAYWDYAGDGDSGNWNPPSTVTHNGTMVKIARTTSDGAWTLTQTISIVGGANPYAKMIMALKNNSGETKDAYLIRYANAVPVSGYPYDQNYGGAFDAAVAYSEDTNGGMLLQDSGPPAPASIGYNYAAFAIPSLTGPAPCDPAGTWVGTLNDSQGSLVDWYLIPTLKKEQTFTVTERYMAF
jgi:hypothetical protein